MFLNIIFPQIFLLAISYEILDFSMPIILLNLFNLLTSCKILPIPQPKSINICPRILKLIFPIFYLQLVLFLLLSFSVTTTCQQSLTKIYTKAKLAKYRRTSPLPFEVKIHVGIKKNSTLYNRLCFKEKKWSNEENRYKMVQQIDQTEKDRIARVIRRKIGKIVFNVDNRHGAELDSKKKNDNFWGSDGDDQDDDDDG